MAGDHLCRICGKTFPSGRSLGGHMRSHVPTSSSANANVDVELSSRSYALRENRKKTWRLSESSSTGEKLCTKCGKGFPSWNSLFGHMRCHAPADHADGDDQFDEEQSEDEAVATRRCTRRWSRCVAAIPASSSSEQEDVAESMMEVSVHCNAGTKKAGRVAGPSHECPICHHIVSLLNTLFGSGIDIAMLAKSVKTDGQTIQKLV